MAKANISNTLVVPVESKVFPYHDDFNEDKNFHRILFRPGYGVQARELTQLQTILQNQIERFGNHVFVNGSPVIGGDVWLQDSLSASINLSSEYQNTEIDATVFLNKIVTLDGDTSTIQFKVREVAEQSSNTPPTLFGDYLTSDVFLDNQTIKVLNENIFANTASANSAAACKFANLRDSIFYMNGYFIKAPAQGVAYSKFNDMLANVKIGIEFSDSIITEDNDSSLLDPALEAFNYQAPGGSRYKIDLNLATRPLDTEDNEKFFELARIEEGYLRKLVKFPVYAEIEEVLARRTYDESGNYTVKPFTINFQADKFDSLNWVATTLSPGKAYIYGYEYETIYDTRIRIPKARTKLPVQNLDLNMNYGNYVIAANLSGDFASTEMGLFDIHCIPYNYINFSSNTAYQATKIGTGRAKAIEFYSGDVDVNARKYEFYLTDTRYRTISSNIASISGNTITLFNGSTLLTSNNNSYNNAILKITSGLGSGYSYNIAGYTGSTRTLKIAGDFLVTPNSTSQASIEFDFNDSKSFVRNINYTPGATANANTNIDNMNKFGGRTDAPTFINEASLDTLVFRLPDQWVANGITGQSYTYTRKYDSVQFTTGVSTAITSGLNENFIGATSSSNVSSTVMNNFYVIVENPQATGRSPGEVLKVTTSITGSAPEQAVFNTSNTSDTFLATVYARVEFDPGVQAKLKNIVTACTKNFASSTGSSVLYNPTTGSNTTVYLVEGQVVIENPTKRVGVAESLYISDVIAVPKIYDLEGQAIPSAAESLEIYRDVTERFEFNNGQKNNLYDHASIKLKPAYASCKGPLIVCCRYYDHAEVVAGGGYFSVDSYPNLASEITEEGLSLGDGYSIIPDFVSTTGEKISLRDAIDFRPKRTNASNSSPDYTVYGAKLPVPTTDFELNYEYYLGRRDLIILSDNRTISRVPGIPSKNPQDPSVPSRSMVLYSLGIEPYTKSYQNVSSKYVENKRYTMRDIGKIEKRVENIEYYISLNALEKLALDVSITDVDGLERTKYGVFVDNFTGHKLGASDRFDYQCAVNFEEGWLQASSNTDAYVLTANVSQSANVVFTKDKVLLKYVNKPFVSQNLATKFAPVSEFLHAGFRGNILTLPEADNWKSTNVEPTIIITDTANNEFTSVRVFQSTVNSQKRK